MKKVKLIVVTAVCMLILACGKSSSSNGPAEPTTLELCQSGWSAYDAAEYNDAAVYFTEALELDDGFSEAYAGRGWACLRSDMLAEAETDFLDFFSTTQQTDYRVLIGLGSIYVTENQGAAVTALLSSHMDIPDSWSHDHDPDITAIDLHNLLAEGFIMTGVEGDEATSGANDPDAWGQVKKSLSLNPTDAKALEIRSFLRGE